MEWFSRQVVKEVRRAVEMFEPEIWEPPAFQRMYSPCV